MTEQDLKLLESYLDDALEDDEARELRRRLAAEPGLVGQLTELRDQRAARQVAWTAMEPGAASVSRLGERVRRAVERRLNFARRIHTVARGVAAAAIFVIGLGVGRYAVSPPDSGVDIRGMGGPAGGSQFITAPAAPPGGYIVIDADGSAHRFATEEQARAFASQQRRQP